MDLIIVNFYSTPCKLEKFVMNENWLPFFPGIPFEKKKFPNLKVGELKCMQSILYDSLENLSVSYFGLRWSIKIKSPWPPCIRGWPIVASTYNSTSIDYPKWNAPNGR